MDSKYLFDRSKHSTNIQDILDNDFDITFFRTDGEPLSKTLTLLPSEQNQSIKDDGSVVYQYNDEYFRCDNFISDHKNTHILFAGCSQTEGAGGPLEAAWPTIMLDLIRSRGIETEGLYSIAKSGFGWEKIISSFMVYAKKYGFPDHLFVLLPNLGRYYSWNESLNQYRYVQKYPTKMSTYGEDHITPKEYFESLMHFAINWKLFLEYCKTNGVNVIWSTWYYEDLENFTNLGIDDQMIRLSKQNEIEYIENSYKSGRPIGKHDIAKRDGHAGIIINEYWATEFLKEFERRNND